MILINRQVNNHYSMGGTHFLQTGYLLLNRNAPYKNNKKFHINTKMSPIRLTMDKRHFMSYLFYQVLGFNVIGILHKI